MNDVKIEVLPIEKGAKRDSQNVNKHTQRGQTLLQNSLRKRGAFRSIASAGKGAKTPVIYAGNLTHEMAVGAGFTEIVNVHVTGSQLVNVVRDDIAPGSPEAIALGIEDNQIGKESYQPDVDVLAALASGDNAVLAVLRQEDKLFSQMVEMMGVPSGEQVDADPEIDRAEELRAKWGVELGQMWQLGEHRIICGDCTVREVVERVMGGEKADCVFTDPPYGVAIGDKNKFLNSFQPSGRNLENIAGDMMGKDELFDMLVKSFTLTHEFMKDDATIYVTSPQGGELGMMMMMMMMSDLPVRHVLNWVKNAPTFSMGKLDYDYRHEPIFYTWKKSHKFYGNGKFKNSVWEIDKPRASKEHPTMKPVELYENGYLNSSQKNDIIYEPFSGSGTAIIACHNLARRCRAIEISPAYVAVALERFSQAFPGVEIVKLS